MLSSPLGMGLSEPPETAPTPHRRASSGPALLAGACVALLVAGMTLRCAPATEETGGEKGRQAGGDPQAARASASLPQPPAAFDPAPSPADNPTTPEKVALGHQLFFDERLSGDGSRSCYSCHVCEKGLTDGLPVAVGAFEKKLTRSSPTLWNIGYHSEFYWDGRSPTLEKQALAAWSGANMGAKTEEVVAALNGVPGYREQFQKVFNGPATPDNVVQALSAYERTLFCGTTPFDRYQQGDQSALSESARRGWEVWRDKAGCGTCHAGILFTDLQYHNVGVGMDKPEPDIGRKKVTSADKDTGAFKTPTLRDIAQSAPYFHDGSVATLEEAVDLMLAGGRPNPWHDSTNLKPVTLTDQERSDLIELLKSLDCECDLKEPPLPQ
ncbi:MAG TPA: cytochrome c peroxidase [Candidatus Polarisedimenticolia bacterium]|nr:cytochrome c peroxidase [Candidatus Polarisedimenticolia bacterium]